MGIIYKGRFVVIVAFMLMLLTACSENGNQDKAGGGTADMEVSRNQTEGWMEEQIYTLSENTEQDDIPEQQNVEDVSEYFTMEEVKALELPEEMLAYWLVLNSKMPFVSYNKGGQEFYWDEFFWSFGAPDTDWLEMYWDYPMLFSIVDMNNDGKNEITISYCGEVRILHYEDGMVYVYQLLERGMSPIYVNGIFYGCGGSGSGYEIYGKFIELGKNGYTFETLAERDQDHYEIGGIGVSEEEYVEYCETINEVGRAERIDYTEELLDEYLLAGLSDEERYMVKHVEAEPMTDTAEYPMEPEIMRAYYEVLTGELEFISIPDDNRKFYLDNYQQLHGEHMDGYQILYFSIVDMDCDGSYEVVLSGVPRVTQILHYENGNIYSYQFDYYEIGSMTSQGVFVIEHNYVDNESVYKYGRIVSFNEAGCDIGEVDYVGDIKDDRIRYYYFSQELIEQYFR